MIILSREDKKAAFITKSDYDKTLFLRPFVRILLSFVMPTGAIVTALFFDRPPTLFAQRAIMVSYP